MAVLNDVQRKWVDKFSANKSPQGATLADLMGSPDVLIAGPPPGGSSLPGSRSHQGPGGGGSGSSGNSSAPSKGPGTVDTTSPPAQPAQGPRPGEVMIPRDSGQPVRMTPIQPDSSIVTINTVNGPEKMTVDEYRRRHADARQWVADQMLNELDRNADSGQHKKPGNEGKFNQQAAKKFGLDANWRHFNRTTVPGTNASIMLPHRPAANPTAGGGGGSKGPPAQDSEIGKAKTQVDPHGDTQKAQRPSGGPKTGGSSAPPAKPSASTPPNVPKSGTTTQGRVTVNYDFRGKDPSVTLKQIDIKDYPPDKEGKVTGYFKDKAFVGGIARMGANLAAQQAADKMLQVVQSHFQEVVQKGSAAFHQFYPTPSQLNDEAILDDHEKAYGEILRYVGEPAHALANGKIPHDLSNNLEGAFAYENAMIDLETRVQQLASELPDLANNIDARARVLLGIRENLEQSFAWIHTHVIGSIPVVHYQSFALWSARGTFDALGNQLSALASTIKSRHSDYLRLIETLETTLVNVGAKLEPWRELYEVDKPR